MYCIRSAILCQLNQSKKPATAVPQTAKKPLFFCKFLK